MPSGRGASASPRLFETATLVVALWVVGRDLRVPPGCYATLDMLDITSLFLQNSEGLGTPRLLDPSPYRPGFVDILSAAAGCTLSTCSLHQNRS